MHVVISCEHGSYEIPFAYRAPFQGGDVVLQSHEGWDLGAQDLALAIFEAIRVNDVDLSEKEGRKCDAVTLHQSDVSRLLVELNRSRRHPRLFSRFTNGLGDDVKKCILHEHWHPYRNEVIADIQAGLARGDVLHLSIHSFTPIFNDVERNAAFGLLYDPSRRDKEIAHQWRTHLRRQLPGYRVRCNYPYTGVQDGFQPWLRKKFSAASRSGAYSAIELEVNNAFLVDERFHQEKSKAASPPGDLNCYGFQQIVAQSVRSLVKSLEAYA